MNTFYLAAPFLQPQGVFVWHIKYFSQKFKTLSYMLAVYMNHNYNLHTKGDYICDNQIEENFARWWSV